jgi:ATP-dependent Clp protease ATP-binding subunit ClpC
MFDRFTCRARKAMALANQSATGYNSPCVDTENIFHGLLKEGTGVGTWVLRNCGVNLTDMRVELERYLHVCEGDMVMGKLPRTEGAERLLLAAIQKAKDLDHNYVGTEHLLLALVDAPEEIVSRVLARFNLKPEEIRDVTSNLLGQGADDNATTT